jgi:L-alanine-DL-glutamate epimerase-like enolase superfamily enzyme
MHPLQPAPLRAAVEIACWDAIARSARQPLCRIWGGDYRPRVPLAVRLPSAAPDRAAQLARDLAERGVHHQIITATGCVDDDLAVLDAVRQSTGDRLKLRIDGAARFPADEARELCRRLERAGLQFLLDPLDTGLDGFAALARQTTVPLAISSAIRGPADVLAVARAGAAPQVVIDIALVGGLWPARKCAIVAAAANLPASLRGGDGLGVALAGMMQLAAATPNLALAHQCAWYQLYDDVLRDRPAIVDGTMAVPQGPGLGVEIDRLRIEAYQVT